MSDSDENVRENRRKPRLKKSTAFDFSVENSAKKTKKNRKKTRQRESSESETPKTAENHVKSESVFKSENFDDVAGFAPISPRRRRNTYELDSTVHQLDLLKSFANSPNQSHTDEESKFVTASENETSPKAKSTNHRQGPESPPETKRFDSPKKKKKRKKSTNEEIEGVNSSKPKTRGNRAKLVTNESETEEIKAEPVKKKTRKVKKDSKVSSNDSEEVAEQGEEPKVVKRKKGRTRKAERKLAANHSDDETICDDNGAEPKSLKKKRRGKKEESIINVVSDEEIGLVEEARVSARKAKRRSKWEEPGITQGVADSRKKAKSRRSKWEESLIVVDDVEEDKVAETWAELKSEVVSDSAKKKKRRSKWEEPKVINCSDDEVAKKSTVSDSARKTRRRKREETESKNDGIGEGAETGESEVVADSAKKKRRSKWEELPTSVDGDGEKVVCDSSRSKWEEPEVVGGMGQGAEPTGKGEELNVEGSEVVHSSKKNRGNLRREKRVEEESVVGEEESCLDSMEIDEVVAVEKVDEKGEEISGGVESKELNVTWTESTGDKWAESTVSQGEELSAKDADSLKGEESMLLPGNVSKSEEPMMSFASYCKSLEPANSSFLSPAQKRKSTRKTWQKNEGCGTPIKLDFSGSVGGSLLESSPPWGKENLWGLTPKSTKKVKNDTRIPTRTKMPDFVKIREKALKKMDNVADHLEKKTLRAQLLLSGNKVPIGIANRKNVTNLNSKKQLQFTSRLKTPKKVATAPTSASKNLKVSTKNPATKPPKSSTKNLLASSILLNSATKQSNPLKPHSNSSSKPKIVSALKTPKKISKTLTFSSNVSMSDKGLDNPFSMRKDVGGSGKAAVSKIEVAKGLVMKKKVGRDRIEEGRKELKGVRLNRRFELMMSMRDGKRS